MQKKKKQIIFSLALIAISVLAIFMLSGCSKKTVIVELDKYVSVSVDGFNEQGVAQIVFDLDSYLEDYGDLIEPTDKKNQSDIQPALAALNEYTTKELSKSENLSNGDVIYLTWKFNNEEARKNYRCWFKGEGQEHTVRNLRELSDFNPFDHISVSFSGYVGLGKLNLEIEDIPEMEYINFTPDIKENLGSDDTVTIYADVLCSDEEFMDIFSEQVVKTEESYHVEGLTKIEQFDPFEHLTVSFQGVGPNASVIITPDYKVEEMNGISFVADKPTGLTEGDVITIVANLQGGKDGFLSKYGKELSVTTQQYTVEGTIDTFDPFEHLSVYFTGEDGEITAMLVPDLSYPGMEDIIFTPSKTSHLKQDSIITVTAEMNGGEEEYYSKYYKVINKTEEYYSITGMQTESEPEEIVGEIDPFEHVDVSVSGTSTNAILLIEPDYTLPEIQYLTFTADKTCGLNINDTVTLTASMNGGKQAYYEQVGKTISETQKTYQVSDLFAPKGSTSLDYYRQKIHNLPLTGNYNAERAATVLGVPITEIFDIAHWAYKEVGGYLLNPAYYGTTTEEAALNYYLIVSAAMNMVTSKLMDPCCDSVREHLAKHEKNYWTGASAGDYLDTPDNWGTDYPIFMTLACEAAEDLAPTVSWVRLSDMNTINSYGTIYGYHLEAFYVKPEGVWGSESDGAIQCLVDDMGHMWTPYEA